MKQKNLKNERGLPKPRSIYPSFAKNLKEYLFEYSKNSSLHCVRYLGEKKRSYIERICWMTIITTSLYLCIFLIIKTYVKWVSSPVIVSFATRSTPVWEIPFPAITVCPEIKAKQRVYNYTSAYHKFHNTPENMTEEELAQFEKASLVCDSNMGKDGNKTVDYSSIEFLSEIAPQFAEVLWQCKWTNFNKSCDSLLTTTLTEEGVCFTFNMLDRDDIFTKEVTHNGDFNHFEFGTLNWSLESGYDDMTDIEAYPLRSFSAGYRSCFSLLMTLYEPDFDYLCKGALQGFKILLHSPSEMPQVSQQYFRASVNQETVVAIKPEMMTTAKGLQSYSPDSRFCFFSSERQLKFFKSYTQRNCEVECLTNYTMGKCGCVAFYMPHNNNVTDICGPGSTTCMEDAKSEMVAKEVDFSIDKMDIEIGDDMKQQTRCNCLPACTSLAYNAESSQADFNWPKVFEAYKIPFEEFPGVAMTRVTFFFKEQQFITSERNELYGVTDFFANCGGLLGLFIGFSILSIIEIFYFITLRIWCNIKRYGFKFWSGSPLLLEGYQKNK